MNTNLPKYDLEYKVDKINQYGEGFAILNSSFENERNLSIPYVLPNEIIEYNKNNKDLLNINSFETLLNNSGVIS